VICASQYIIKIHHWQKLPDFLSTQPFGLNLQAMLASITPPPIITISAVLGKPIPFPD
jgi:hypothetical protein